MQEVIDDLKLTLSGTVIHFVVDPHDIIDFCFPVSVDGSSEPDLSLIADDQAARFYALNGRDERPVLLPEYADELNRHLLFLQHTAIDAFDEAEDMLPRLVEKAASNEGDQDRKLVDALEKDFNILLAAVMGIYSFGADRFQQVAARLVNLGDVDISLQKLAKSYRESSLVAPIWEQLLQDLRNHGFAESEMTRLRTAARIDARAIDRVIYMNKAFTERRPEADEKAPFLAYFSSSARSRRIFELPIVKDYLAAHKIPRFLRTKEQSFIYLVHKSREVDPKARLEQTINNLEDFRDAISQVNTLESSFLSEGQQECDRCVLDGGHGGACRWLPYCDAMRTLDESVRNRRRRIENLGLANRIQDYHRLLRAKANGSQMAVLDRFRRISENTKVPDLALRKMHTLQLFSIAQSNFASMLPRALHRTPGELLREGRDAVTGASQFMPIRPKVVANTYRAILDNITLFLKYSALEDRPDLLKAAFNVEDKSDLLKTAYKMFIEADARLKESNPEHELVRCFLFLTFPDREGDERAYSHAKTWRTIFPDHELEFDYLVIWAGRRLKEFQEVDDCVNLCLIRFPEDGRVYHGQALNIYAWLSDSSKQDSCPYDLRQAVAASEKALECYSNSDQEGEIIAACLNNVAYFSSYRREGDAYDLDRSRRALEALKRQIPKAEWHLFYPEYLHTEAHLEYEEFLRGFRTGTDPKALEGKLESALTDIGVALSVRPKQLYADLKRDIEKALTTLNSGRR